MALKLSAAFLHSSVNECIEKGELSRSPKQALITLIEEKGKDRSLTYRKLATYFSRKCRCKNYVLSQSHQNKKCSTQHYSSQSNWIYKRPLYLRSLVKQYDLFSPDIMDFTVQENIPGLLIFLDFQKAFDSLEWNFLLRCLESFNFGSTLIPWVFSQDLVGQWFCPSCILAP